MAATEFAVNVGWLIMTQAENQPVVPGAAGTMQSAPLPAAQPGAAGGTGAPNAAPPPASNPFGSMWIIFLPILALLIISSMGGRKQAKQRAALLASLKKSDRVLTSGGIVGTVVELYDQEMVLRVDEASNTRIRFARSAVAQVLKAQDGARSDLELKPKSEPANAH